MPLDGSQVLYNREGKVLMGIESPVSKRRFGKDWRCGSRNIGSLEELGTLNLLNLEASGPVRKRQVPEKEGKK